MVIFHSYVSLPEGILLKLASGKQKAMENCPFIEIGVDLPMKNDGDFP
jgi:hypothetical protein